MHLTQALRVGAPNARPAPVVANSRLRGVRTRRRLACCAQLEEGVGAGTQKLGGVQLDAAAATVARLRTLLPYPVARELIGADVKYSFLSPLVSVSGRGDYVRVMEHWKRTVPGCVGDGWKFETVRVFQPDARTLVVKWRMSWFAAGLFGVSPWSDSAAGSPKPSSGEVGSGEVGGEGATVSVARLVQSLSAAEKSIELGLSALDASSTPPSASAALRDGLRSLREGVQQSQALASEVATAEAAVDRPGWLSGLIQDDPQLLAEWAAMKEEATSRVTGSSTFVLDAEGLVISHADTLDLDESQQWLEAAAREMEAADSQDRAMREVSNRAGAVLSLCLAMRLPERGSWEWRLDVVRQLLWESFIRDEDTDDEMRISVTREDFDELVTLVIAGITFVALASTSYLAYWLVFVAPELPAQLAKFSDLAPADDLAALRSGQWMSSWMATLSGALQPSLFR